MVEILGKVGDTCAAGPNTMKPVMRQEAWFTRLVSDERIYHAKILGSLKGYREEAL